MKKSLKVLILLIICSQMMMEKSFTQESSDSKKIETIINLTRFFDWSQNVSFNHSGKMLYVITDPDLKINYEKSIQNTSVYKDWNIVFSDRIVDFKMGSVVFVTKSKKKYLDVIIGLSQRKDILTIAENNDSFCQKGGMINIKEQNGQVKFEINYRIIQDKSLDISSKLLALSKIYEK